MEFKSTEFEEALKIKTAYFDSHYSKDVFENFIQLAKKTIGLNVG